MRELGNRKRRFREWPRRLDALTASANSTTARTRGTALRGTAGNQRRPALCETVLELPETEEGSPIRRTEFTADRGGEDRHHVRGSGRHQKRTTIRQGEQPA